MRKYKVANRKPIVDFFSEALELSGYRIISPPDPNQGPFELTVKTPHGKPLDLVCYAFLANKYNQKNRPDDEHRFQIKYGSDFQGYHEIYIDAARRRLTLMFGVHLEERIVVAVDPTMHNPTRFSRSIFFKDHHVEQTKQSGWFSWHRPRQLFGGRRRRAPPQPTRADEALLGLTVENFGRYIELELLATGMNPKARILLAERFLGEQDHPKRRKLDPWEVTRGEAQVFISYSHADSEFVNFLEKSLQENHIRCWRDLRSLTAGPIEDQIKRGIESNPVILVLSANSLNSRWVEWEASYAQSLGRKLGRHILCPVAIDRSWLDAPWSGPLKEHIKKYVVLDFSGWQESGRYQDELKKLVAGLRDYYLKPDSKT